MITKCSSIFIICTVDLDRPVLLQIRPPTNRSGQNRIDCLKIVIINVINIIFIVEEVCARLLLFHVLLRAFFVDSEDSGERIRDKDG